MLDETGLMAGYQKFEYAVSYWLQKTAEHVFGSVLCSPGCFSLYSAEAIRHNGSYIMKRFSEASSEVHHFIQYDQGEDRWLSTMLLQQGFKIEYLAASEAYTQCPESFKEFFNQRRRWLPSTVANILDLISSAGKTCRINPNVSMVFILYQILMMITTVLGPMSIFFYVVQSFTFITGIDDTSSIALNLIPVTIFIVICLTVEQKYQIFFAQVLSSVYAILFFVLMLNIAKETLHNGLFATASFFLLFLVLIVVIAALLHPSQSGDLQWGLLYWVLIPTMNLLLVIYTIANLTDISWGTREKASDAEYSQNIESSNNTCEETNNGEIASKIRNYGIGATFKRNKDQNDKHGYSKVPWFNDNLLPGQARLLVDEKEAIFWKNLLDAKDGILHPPKMTSEVRNKMSKKLINLRSQVVLWILFLNAVYVVIVVMPIQRFVNYVFASRSNIHPSCNDHLSTHVNSLQNEHICVALFIPAALILSIQFIGMLLYRIRITMQRVSSMDNPSPRFKSSILHECGLGSAVLGCNLGEKCE